LLATSRKNKGKSPAMAKYMENISEVMNNIIPLYKKLLHASGKILSGQRPTYVFLATKDAYYCAQVTRNHKLSKQMPAS